MNATTSISSATPSGFAATPWRSSPQAGPTGARIEFFGDEVDRISEFNVVTGAAERIVTHCAIYPASHYVTTKEKMERATREIACEMMDREKWFKENGKLLEAQRIHQRTMYDIEMMDELGFCSGIENYSRIISGRPAGSPPMTLMDYFPGDFLMFIDESHVTLPRCGPCTTVTGQESRRWWITASVSPSAYDNRPAEIR